MRRRRDIERALSSPRPGRGLGLAALISILALPGAPLELSAQVGIEKQRPGNDELGTSGSFTVDFARDSGNVDAVSITVDSRADHVRERSRSFILVQLEQAWESDEQYLDEGLVHIRDVRRTNRRVRWESFAQADFNTIRLLDFRWLAGGGIRASLTKQTKKNWVGTSLMFEHEELNLAPAAVHAATTEVVRWSSYLSLGGETKALTWSWSTYVQPQVDEFGDYRILSDATIEIELSKSVGWSFSIVGRHDSRPPDGVRRTDRTLASGLVIKWRRPRPTAAEDAA